MARSSGEKGDPLTRTRRRPFLGLKRDDRGPKAALREAVGAWGKWFGDVSKPGL